MAGISDDSSEDEPLINLVKKNHTEKQMKTKTKASAQKKSRTPKKTRKKPQSGNDQTRVWMSVYRGFFGQIWTFMVCEKIPPANKEEIVKIPQWYTCKCFINIFSESSSNSPDDETLVKTGKHPQVTKILRITLERCDSCRTEATGSLSKTCPGPNLYPSHYWCCYASEALNHKTVTESDNFIIIFL